MLSRHYAQLKTPVNGKQSNGNIGAKVGLRNGFSIYAQGNVENGRFVGGTAGFTYEKGNFTVDSSKNNDGENTFSTEYQFGSGTVIGSEINWDSNGNNQITFSLEQSLGHSTTLKMQYTDGDNYELGLGVNDKDKDMKYEAGVRRED